MRPIAVRLALIMLLATPVRAQIIKYADWAAGPAGYLMTKEEKAEWKTISNDDRARAFIDLFWARRDPTPDTPRNEFHERFDAMVALADKQFSSAHALGSMSDPGRVLILLGPPYQVATKASSPAPGIFPGGTPGTAPTDPDGSLSVPRPIAEPVRQVWTYAHDRKPKFVARPDFVLVFTDEGQNEWQLAHTERANPDAILAQAVQAIIVSPNLTKPPFPSETLTGNVSAFANAALKTSYDAFRSSEKPSVGPASLTWGEFVTPEGDPFVASQLYVPAGSGISAGQDVTFFSVIESDAGDIVEVHEESTKMIAVGKDSYVDASVHLQPGHYKATFGIASNSTILSATRTELQVEPLDPAKSAVSPLLLSTTITPLETTWHADDPFTFGGLKVVPKGDAVFPANGNLWYFVEMRNPGLTDQKNPAVDVQVEISGTTAKGPARMRFPMSPAEIARLKGTKERYAIGLAIPLENFKPGEYTMKVHLVDTVLSRTYDLEKPFKISGL
jgi:GWxTD domain-containing protein